MTIRKIEDSKIISFWYCMDDDCRIFGERETAIVHPNWYQDNGTPVCNNCDRDMVYSHTEVDCG